MPLDYSRFDDIELSDDEDIEVHPNIDKASWIRFKQKELHEERAKRRQRIEEIGAELQLTEVLRPRLLALTQGDKRVIPTNLASTLEELKTKGEAPDAEKQEGGTVSYDSMLATLLAQIQAEMSKETEDPSSLPESWVEEKILAAAKAMDEKNEREKKERDELIKAANSKMTSENMFKESKSRTLINKPSSEDSTTKEEDEVTGKESGASSSSSVSTTAKKTTVEVLNPEQGQKTTEVDPSQPISVQFSHLNKFEDSWKMLRQHPELYKDETPWEEVMALAFEASTEKNYPRMENCIRQGKILEYVRELGPGRLDLFFQRMLGTGEMARRTYFDDVTRTIAYVRKRGGVMREERVAQDAKRAQLAEEDQDSPLEMQIPEDATEEDKKRAAAFDTFPPRFQRALLSGDLEKVNEALSHIDAEEQQRILDLCGSVGFLDIEGTVDEEDGKTKGEEEGKGKEASTDLAETLD